MGIEKKAVYRQSDGSPLEVVYDPGAPCRVCRAPVVEASVGGTDVCPSCDVGRHRICGCSWSYKEALFPEDLVPKHNCLQRFLSAQTPLDPELDRLVNEHFWNLL